MMSDKDYDPICCTEEKKYIMKEILARTKAKQIPWKCKDVAPLSFHEIAAEDLLLNPALVQMFVFQASFNQLHLEMSLLETIDLHTQKGNFQFIITNGKPFHLCIEA